VAIDQIVFALITLAAGFGVMAYGTGLPARLALLALALFVMWAGPQVFGKDWYHEGFIAGLFFGDFYGTITTR
jgi:hypothetical protein